MKNIQQRIAANPIAGFDTKNTVANIAVQLISERVSLLRRISCGRDSRDKDIVASVDIHLSLFYKETKTKLLENAKKTCGSLSAARFFIETEFLLDIFYENISNVGRMDSV